VTFTFNVSWPPLAMSVPSLPDGTAGVPYPGVTFSATGGTGTYSWFADARRSRAGTRTAVYQLPHSSAGLGSSGGVRNAGGAVRSSAPSGAIAAASRRVSAGRFHFSSTSLSTEV
jgi:hypothetical protein